MEQLTQITKFTSLIQMIKALPTDNDCRLYLENLVWNGSPKCPHCKSESHYKLKSAGQYKCVDCQQRYNVKDKTMFEGSHIGLHKWFIAIYIFSLHKKGISSHQLASDISITQKAHGFCWGALGTRLRPMKMQLN